VVRAFIVLCSWPILKAKNSYGKKWGYEEFSVLMFCGLRGTVGLALALIAGVVLRERNEKHDERNSGIILFTMVPYVCCKNYIYVYLLFIHNFNPPSLLCFYHFPSFLYSYLPPPPPPSEKKKDREKNNLTSFVFMSFTTSFFFFNSLE
jgi:hypothetical protein